MRPEPKTGGISLKFPEIKKSRRRKEENGGGKK
jgi:hypothetical protein